MAKQKDGRYRAKITVGHGTAGKPIYKYVSATTKRGLEEEKARVRQLYINGLTDVNQDVLFGVYAKEWYETYKKPHIGAGTRGVYASALNKHILPEYGDRQLRAIRAAELQQFMNDHVMSRSAVGTIYSAIRAIFFQAASEGIITVNPALALKKYHVPEEPRRELTEAETVAALKVGTEHPEGLLLLLLYYTGVRVGEALGLQWRDIDFAKKTIRVERDIDFKTNGIGAVKTAASVRDVPLPPELAAALDKVRGIGETFVLTSPKTHTFLCEATYKRRWERLQIAMFEADNEIEIDELSSSKRRRAKYEKEKKGKKNKRGIPYKEPAKMYGSALTAHFFRHNYCTLLYEAGVDVMTAQRFMGHADARTTLAIYTHLSKRKEAAGADIVRGMFSNKVAEKLPDKNKTRPKQ